MGVDRAFRRAALIDAIVAVAGVLLSFAFAMAGSLGGTLVAFLLSATAAAAGLLNGRRARLGGDDADLAAALGRYLDPVREPGPAERVALTAGIAFPATAAVGLSFFSAQEAIHHGEVLGPLCAALCALSIALTCAARIVKRKSQT